MSPAVASAHINKLEEELSIRLIHRTTRKVSLTEDGTAFLPHAEEILASIEAAHASVGAGDSLPKGNLRVTAPSSFGRMHLMPTLKGFFSHYPDLSIDLHLSDSIVDLVEGGFDIAIHNADLKSSTLIARKLAPDRRIICASPEYLEKYSEPIHPDDLRDHQCINLMGLESWIFETPRGQLSIKTKGRLQTDHGEAVRNACVEGLGIAMPSTWSVYQQLERGELVQVLRDYLFVSHAAIWAVYPSSRLLAPKVRAFINYLAGCYGSPPYWDQKLQGIIL